MVLPLALFALVVIAALVGSAFAAAFVEQRVGRNTLYAVQAAGVTEAGAAEVVGEWEAHGLSLLGVGESRVLAGGALPGRGVYTPTVRRLNDRLFRLDVEGLRTDADGRPLARRQLGVTLRLADSAGAGLPPVVPLANRAWTLLSP
jgi:hypothetical protein